MAKTKTAAAATRPPARKTRLQPRTAIWTPLPPRRPARWAEAALALGTSSAVILHGIIVLAMPPAAAERRLGAGAGTVVSLRQRDIGRQPADKIPRALAPAPAAPLRQHMPDAVGITAQPPAEAARVPLSEIVTEPGAAAPVLVAGPIDAAALAAARQQADRAIALRQKIRFQAQAPETCLPPNLVGVLYDIAEKFGSVRIASTHRDPVRNRRVGGKSKSFHLQCRAIDFFVDGQTKGLIDYLKTRAEVGGYKRYRQGFFHIDDGPRRTW